MSTFCRITGKSRGLPKPNYFPLLPPISPADAKRFCRITGKSYGLPSHNYIPVSLMKNSRKRTCRITGNEAPHKFAPEVKRKRVKKKRHVFIAEYRYVSPVLEGVTDQQKLLLELLSTKDGRKISLPDNDSHFVYSVEERNCVLVFPSTLEAAVRDGEIRDIMLDRDSDTVMLKLNKGRNISVEFKEIVPKVDEKSELFEGEGPSADVLKERKKQEEETKKIKRTNGLKSVKKIFEEKERIAEMQVEKELEITEQKKSMVAEVMLKAEINNEIKAGKEEVKDRDTMTEEEEREMLNDWKRFDPRHSRAETSLFMCSGDWRDLLKPLVETWDWEEVENELSRSNGTPIITTLPSPTSLKAEVINLGEAIPGIVQSKPLGLSDEIGGLEPIPSVAPFTPLVAEPDEEVQRALKNIRDTELLLKTANVKKLFVETTDLEAEKLKALFPKLKEIPDLVSHLENGVVSEIEQNGEKVFGLIIDIGTAKRFVVGQTVITPNGSVFVPGETINTPIGLEFVPGFVIKYPGSESPVLIPGQKVVALTEDSGENPAAVFVAGQTLMTRDGEKFVAGQTVSTADGPKFMPGQTVITPDGAKFIPGQLVPSKTVMAKEGEEQSQDRLEKQQNAPLTFVPGQSVMTSEGLKFVPGQTIITALGDEIFIAGQSVETEKGWEFVPGQSVKTDNGETKFVAGQTIMTNEGPTFIPGQVVHNDEGPPTFVPGVTIEGKDGTKFVPGKTLQTSEGLKFVEGQIVKTATGSTTFVPGKTTFDENVKFSVASKLEDIVLNEVIHIPKDGLQPINPCSEVVRTHHASTLYGHVVQTIHGVEFFPGPVTSALPAGRIVPGKLEQSAEGKVKFFPGKLLVDTNGIETFVPGQMVMTEKGDQFVPGQVIETSEGAKFVPGQVVESRAGPKFVPGQTMETPEGRRFIPGQIVETAVGPTFIPGQIISTEEGSKFVPGEVLETTEGPRFVPGRVIETEDNTVRFAPGQIVQTKEGQFHFVAPDLQDIPGGDFQFLVQGFEVTPEELQLLRPAYITPSYIPTTGGEMSIDSRMLRQLSEAGMSLGRQVSTDIPAVDIRPRRAMLSEVKSVLQTAAINKVEILKDLLQEQYTEESIMERLSVVLKNDAARVSPEKVGNAREQALETAFLHLSRGNPEFMERVLQKVSQQVDILETEKAATQALQRAIISVVHECSDQRVRAILEDVTVMDAKEENVWNTKDHGGLKTLILQAVGLARALGMSDVATGLLEVLNDPHTTQILAKDRMTMDILRRLTVMRQLAERNPNHYMALRQLQNDPESAKTDPRLRDLVRESAALMVVPEEDYMPLESSKDIPSTLLHSNNLLAMEEFLFSRNQQTTGTILILKPGFQCVIPRENARGILTGQMAFTVLDENGIRHFEPLHVFSALHMPRIAAHHFSMYSCPVVREEETTFSTYTAATLTPGSSCDDLGMLDSYMQPSETTTTRRRGTSDSIDASALSYTRLNGIDDDDTLATSGYNTPRQNGRRRGTLDGQNASVYTKCNGERSPTPPSGYDTPDARTMDSYTLSEENSPTYGKYGNTNGESTFGDTSTRTFGSEMFDVYAVNQSFNADDGDSISLKKGDLVEVLDSGQESFKLRSRNSSYLLDKYKNLNSYIESGHGAAPRSILKNPRSPSHSSGSAKSLTFDSSRLSGGALLSREDMYGSRVLRENHSPIDTRRTHEYSRAYASPKSYDTMKVHDALVTDTYKLKLNDPSLPYSSPRCYDYLGSCGGSRIYDPLRPFNSRRFYESLQFADPVQVASPSAAYGYCEPTPSRKITSPSSIHAAYSPNPYDPYAHYNAQPMSTYEPKLYEMSPERDTYNPVSIRKTTFRLSESPEPFDTQKLESKYRELSPEISVSRKLRQSPEPADFSRPVSTDYEPQFSSIMQRINIRANILGGKKLNSGSK